MPVRSLNSPVLKWPDRQSVHQALERWLAEQAARRPGILRAGYIGSYARGDWGVGSDLDILMIVADSRRPFWQRPLDFDLSAFPVPCDLLVYTLEEWQEMAAKNNPLRRVAGSEAIWVYQQAPPTE